MSVEPTGQISREGDQRVLTITRQFRAPIEAVWASVTEPERLARWIGTFTGDAASGRVAFLMTFSQPDIDPVAAESVGPGWEYYLDRLVAAEGGGDVEAIDFDRDYYPAMQEHYRSQAG